MDYKGDRASLQPNPVTITVEDEPEDKSAKNCRVLMTQYIHAWTNHSLTLLSLNDILQRLDEEIDFSTVTVADITKQGKTLSYLLFQTAVALHSPGVSLRCVKVIEKIYGSEQLNSICYPLPINLLLWNICTSEIDDRLNCVVRLLPYKCPESIDPLLMNIKKYVSPHLRTLSATAVKDLLWIIIEVGYEIRNIDNFIHLLPHFEHMQCQPAILKGLCDAFQLAIEKDIFVLREPLQLMTKHAINHLNSENPFRHNILTGTILRFLAKAIKYDEENQPAVFTNLSPIEIITYGQISDSLKTALHICERLAYFWDLKLVFEALKLVHSDITFVEKRAMVKFFLKIGGCDDANIVQELLLCNAAEAALEFPDSDPTFAVPVFKFILHAALKLQIDIKQEIFSNTRDTIGM